MTHERKACDAIHAADTDRRSRAGLTNMKQFYKNVNFTPRTLEHIAVIGGIIGEYVAQGYRLTVRQLYYQLVARGIIENTMQSYKRTTGVVNDARMAGC
jgi:hypothetical protein